MAEPVPDDQSVREADFRSVVFAVISIVYLRVIWFGWFCFAAGISVGAAEETAHTLFWQKMLILLAGGLILIPVVRFVLFRFMRRTSNRMKPADRA